MELLKKRILVETDYLGANVSCISTVRGLVYIDSPFLPENGQQWGELTRKHTGQEGAYVINTDHHYDHVMGNQFLAQKIICHIKAAKGMGYLMDKKLLKQVIQDAFPDVLPKYEEAFDNFAPVPPHITFDKGLSLDMGNGTFQLEFVGGHSPATILIYLIEEKVLFTGDNVEGQFPFFGQAHFGRWKDALQKMRTMDVERVVPGHGPIGGKEMVEKYWTFFTELESEVKTFQAQGLTTEEMAEKSKTIFFFPNEEIADRDPDRAWIKRQYRLAAEAVLRDL